MENIGYIYKITNKVNGKVYIGQTIDSIESRFREHIYDSNRKNKNCYEYPLYRAFRKYGIDKFFIEEVEKCDILKLDDREIYWIKYFNSKYKGYNQSFGGSGFKRYNLDEQKVISEYLKKKNISEISKQFNCSRGVITRILRKNDIKTLSGSEVTKNIHKTVYQYDEKHNLLNVFNSFPEAGEWLIKNNLSKAKTNIIASMTIKHTLISGKNKFKGYIWKCVPNFTEEEINDYIKRRKVYNANSKNNKKITYIKNKKNVKLKEISICRICGNEKSSKSNLCDECNRKQVHNISEQNREEKYSITREILKEKIRTMPFIKIAEEYNVSDNAIRKRCKSYSLPYKSSEIKKYSNEEWENL